MSIGVWQVVIILVIVLIIFGAGKLPHVMGDVAKGIKNFKSGMAEDGDGEGKEQDKKKIEEGGTGRAADTAAKATRTEAETTENKQG